MRIREVEHLLWHSVFCMWWRRCPKIPTVSAYTRPKTDNTEWHVHIDREISQGPTLDEKLQAMNDCWEEKEPAPGTSPLIGDTTYMHIHSIKWIQHVTFLKYSMCVCVCLCVYKTMKMKEWKTILIKIRLVLGWRHKLDDTQWWPKSKCQETKWAPYRHGAEVTRHIGWP